MREGLGRELGAVGHPSEHSESPPVLVFEGGSEEGEAAKAKAWPTRSPLQAKVLSESESEGSAEPVESSAVRFSISTPGMSPRATATGEMHVLDSADPPGSAPSTSGQMGWAGGLPSDGPRAASTGELHDLGFADPLGSAPSTVGLVGRASGRWADVCADTSGGDRADAVDALALSAAFPCKPPVSKHDRLIQCRARQNELHERLIYATEQVENFSDLVGVLSAEYYECADEIEELEALTIPRLPSRK